MFFCCVYLQLPENIDAKLPPEVGKFIDVVQSACEVQVHSSLDKVRQLLVNLAEDLEAVIKCIRFTLKFPSKQSKFVFLSTLLEGDLSHKIAAVVYDEDFCSKFTTISDDVKLMKEEQKVALQSVLEQITDLITVNIYFKVDQIIDQEPMRAEQTVQFQFSLAASKLLRPHHDTKSGDTQSATRQIKEYLKQDADVYELFERTMFGK